MARCDNFDFGVDLVNLSLLALGSVALTARGVHLVQVGGKTVAEF
eukprot:CAMPEP_0202502952 /NCGR_PEP_ID=MMETSP1361-20130828/40483_1 /ASSEMBLY_ACC=CAM_ASM_000849 /TAXON_ID=210615 /ORGANISM="Staurosira complex sp., Strain CCMP2646" /LENGTH=44 /DNA_ID= /DNA_START= /DNA_END= /DNA_ORIENTATION=